jgi:DNA ligase-1
VTLLHKIARTSAAVAETSSRLGKVGLLSECLRRMRPEEVPVAVAYLSGTLPQGTIGVGWASLRDLPGPAAGPPSLEVLETDAIHQRIASTTGPGSVSARRDLLSGLFARATEPERRFLFGLLLGELRQGALEGIMVEAVAGAAAVPASEIRRAAMVAGDLGTVAKAVMTTGRSGLTEFLLVPLQPVKPMLAQTADDLDDALARISPASVEWKLDGARIHAHRLGDEVRVFTRSLADATHRLPEIADIVRALPVESVILDGEAIALRKDQRPQPFQVTMSRFGTRLAAKLHEAASLAPFFFDCLLLDGQDLTDRPAVERFEALERSVPDVARVPRVVTGELDEAREVMEESLARGHEGVMVKALDTPYQAGRRGGSWLKVKRAHTLDLVVLAAEWGHGRRRGWLSNLHLGARDPDTGGFVMLGKTFKGMTDEMLRWQTERFQELETHRDEFAVYIRPEVVVEVAFDGLLPSPRYPGGLALRFARVKGYRPDKGPEDADTIDTVRAIHSGRPSGP